MGFSLHMEGREMDEGRRTREAEGARRILTAVLAKRALDLFHPGVYLTCHRYEIP